jgi:hypothetical protein
MKLSGGPQSQPLFVPYIRMFSWQRELVRAIEIKFLSDKTKWSARNFTNQYLLENVVRHGCDVCGDLVSFQNVGVCRDDGVVGFILSF